MDLLRRCGRSRVTWALLLALSGLGSAHAAPSQMEGACTASASALGLPSSGAAMLTVLSPRMVYALREWPRMKAAAQERGFEVIVRRDPQVPYDEWRAALLEADLPELGAVPAIEPELAASCGLLNHFPSTLVARCDHVHPWPVLGVMPSDMWQVVLAQRLESLPCL